MQAGKIAFLSLGLFLAVSITTGQTIKNITLDEAVQLSLQNSKQLKYNKAKIEEAHALLQQARMNQLPDVSGTASYLRMHNPNVNLKLENPQTKQLVSSASNLKINQVAYSMVTASLPIFGGFGIRYGIESSKYLVEATTDRRLYKIPLALTATYIKQGYRSI